MKIAPNAAFGISLKREPILSLLRDFLILTGIHSLCLTINKEISISLPDSLGEFCALLRQDPRMEACCNQCDSVAIAHVESSGEVYRYHCHAGLCEAIVPLFDGDLLLGYLMMGQVLDHEPTGHSWHHLRSRLDMPDDRVDALRSAYFRLPSMTEEQVEAAFRMLGRQASLILASEWVRARAMPLMNRLETHIQDNMSGSLMTHVLAEAMGMSSSRLSHLVKEQTGLTVTQCVLGIRMREAARLLQTSSLPIGVIASRTGWADPKYFSRMFQRWFGMAPRQYRTVVQSPATD
mgnify:CR=1 FL=1